MVWPLWKFAKDWNVLQLHDLFNNYNRRTEQAVDQPDRLRKWDLINVGVGVQIAEIWSHLRYQVEVISNHQCHCVFPTHVKEFESKLQMFGWDIPIFITDRTAAEVSLTAGFSGTNDNRRLLRLTIQQDDLPGLAYTNAEVLTCVLQERNWNYIAAVNKEGNHLPETQLLAKLKGVGIRLLIDTSAHILER